MAEANCFSLVRAQRVSMAPHRLACAKENLQYGSVAEDLKRCSGVFANRHQTLPQSLPKRMQSLVNLRFSQLFQRRPAGRTRHWIAGQRTAQKAVRTASLLPRIGKLQQIPFCHHPRERMAAADDFSIGSQIRHDAVSLLRAAPSDSKSRHDLIENEHDTMLPRNL